MKKKLTRRNILKTSGVALGGLALGGIFTGCETGGTSGNGAAFGTPPDHNNLNSLISDLPPYYPGTETLGPDEMRITFLGTSCIPRQAQECNSIYVETGNGEQFVFDCGTGVSAKYQAMRIPFRKMDKIFLTHLHGDHMSDLTHIYCFGPATDRKSPLYIWGHAKSNVPEPGTGVIFEDGLKVFCERFRDMNRWHTESFSFGATRDNDYVPPTQTDWGLPIVPTPIGTDDPHDGYAIVPIELDWTLDGGVAYDNPTTNVKITHFPAIHCRKGSMSYKLEWNGMSMIFSGDTKPNKLMLAHASGVDVLIHEMVVPAEIWAMKNLGITNKNQVDPALWNAGYDYALAVQNSSHTPQGAFGYLLSKMTPPPRLAVATHFQATDDTIASAMTSIRNHYPVGDVTIAADFMVINVTPTSIRKRRAIVSDYSWYPKAHIYPHLDIPKYHHPNGTMDPIAQIDPTQEILPSDPITHVFNYREDGY